MRLYFVFQEIWIGLRRNLTMTISLVITVAIAMALFGTGMLLKKQVDSSKTYWYDRVNVSIYLCAKTSSNQACGKKEATQKQREDLIATLKELPEVAEVDYETKGEAFERFKELFANTPGMIAAVKEGDIPDSLRVRLVDPSNYASVISASKNTPGVDQIVNERELLEKLFRILGGLQWAALFIALIQVFAAVLLVGNTVRLSAFSRRRETNIMRLVGASNMYIQLPFILEGAIAGLLGGVIAALLLVGSKLLLIDRLQESLQFATQLTWTQVAGVIIFSMAVGVLLCAGASFLTLRRYLKI
ncbi:permease-like cell division protein FtsX [Actinocorallia sp. A-T 12471]|uniref:permease-like cell division protein FtsX n=1 Tax=Actinocorallia sp. A-T 12471 TaxID=3089813 RepID=UPI0029D38104|nr:permease-like cell division protein FtsX [Actinocorallia sp. A-T 12471]MDX6744542.1 permease-like cell division protein FtsX [Actinocorallia sp. A-T 12471]